MTLNSIYPIIAAVLAGVFGFVFEAGLAPVIGAAVLAYLWIDTNYFDLSYSPPVGSKDHYTSILSLALAISWIIATVAHATLVADALLAVFIAALTGSVLVLIGRYITTRI